MIWSAAIETTLSYNSNADWNPENMASYISNVARLTVAKATYCPEQNT
jgi:hypothetical protein